VSDPHGETPHLDHPQDDDFALELPLEHETAAPPGHHEGAAAEEPHPLDALGLNASTEDFQFLGPVEELDFTEPADFTFPTDAPGEAEAVADSTAEFASADHGEMEHLFGTAEAVPEDAVAEEALAEAEAAPEAAEAEPVLDEAAQQAEADLGYMVPAKRELPAWVHTLEWTTVSVLAAASVIALFVGIIWIPNPDTVTLILNVCCPLMLVLIPYALWRSNRRWTAPAGSVLYTILLVLSAAALIGGTWVEGTELANYKWQFNKARVAAGKPSPKIIVLPPETTNTGNPAGNAAPAK
jgi:hypothetical protein